MYFKTKMKAECTGCTACLNSCPRKCIKMHQDNEGFLYPVIDKDKCVECGLCEKVCPVENPIFNNSNTPSVYAAYVNDIQERQKSSSGGVFYVIAKWVIDNGGIVFGSTIDNHNQVYHCAVERTEDLSILRGSKYVQSDLRNVFLEVKEALKLNRYCYFVGTPCQVAGLKACLRKDYANLLTSDLVCHGVPSQWIFDQHISFLERKYNGEIHNYRFRDNKAWRGCEIFEVERHNGSHRTIINPTYHLSPYLYSFMYGMISRYSCYDCKFAIIPRQGDITLADYWGAERLFADIESKSGVSLVLCNTTKGEEILKKIKDSVTLIKSSVEDASRFNANLIHTSDEHPIRDIVYEEIRNKGYKKVAETVFRSTDYYKLKLLHTLLNSTAWKLVRPLFKR